MHVCSPTISSDRIPLTYIQGDNAIPEFRLIDLLAQCLAIYHAPSAVPLSLVVARRAVHAVLYVIHPFPLFSSLLYCYALFCSVLQSTL